MSNCQKEALNSIYIHPLTEFTVSTIPIILDTIRMFHAGKTFQGFKYLKTKLQYGNIR